MADKDTLTIGVVFRATQDRQQQMALIQLQTQEQKKRNHMKLDRRGRYSPGKTLSVTALRKS